MDQAVPSVHRMPLFIKTSLGERLTVIAVDPAVPTIEKSHHDVIFVGTTRGRVLKLVNSARNHPDAQPLPVLIEAIQVNKFSLFVLDKYLYRIQLCKEGTFQKFVISELTLRSKSKPMSFKNCLFDNSVFRIFKYVIGRCISFVYPTVLMIDFFPEKNQTIWEINLQSY